MKIRKKIFVAALVAAAVVFSIKYAENVTRAKAVMGDTISKCDELSYAMSNYVNQNGLKLLVDGNEVHVHGEDFYLDGEMRPLINKNLLTKTFQCAVSVNDSHIIIEKGMVSAVLSVGSDTIIAGEQTYKMSSSVVKNSYGTYVPIEALTLLFSYSYQWDSINNTVVLSNDKPDEKVYPFAYDYRNVGRAPRVKDQANFGTCWAFASLSAIESTFLPEKNLDFSEDHMTYHNGYNITQNDGGEFNIAMAYLASWAGPVFEKDDPYGDGFSPMGLKETYHVQEMQIIESKNLDDIKKSVFLYGGVQSSLYMSINDTLGEYTANYNPEHSSYCYIGTEKANHDIVIVGWDDSYPAENFITKPTEDGAFICINSWGSSFGEDGYFYVSYYDSNIGIRNIVYTDIQETDNYDKLYQSDICGWVGLLGYGREYAYFANVYEVEENETLEAVGFYSTGANTSYEIYFVDSFEGPDSLKDMRLVGTGLASHAGYYTVNIHEKNVMLAGQKYAVIVYVNTPNSVHPIAIEYNSNDYTSTVDTSDGEGYISFNGKQWEHVEETQNCNVCLKMYTKLVKEEKITEGE